MNYKIDKCKNYKQYDTRWAKLSYRVLPACVRLNGCGATSIADIACAVKTVTPKDTRSFLLKYGYVSANQGTYWSGIPAAMVHYGLTDVQNHATMTGLFNAMSKTKRVGVILFRKGTRGGRTYTTGGHFCAIAGYKKVGSKHYLYIMDPGPRANNGWICYETEMRGLCLQVWSGKVPTTKKKTVKKPVTKPVTKPAPVPETEPIKSSKKTTAQKFINKLMVTYQDMKEAGYKYSASGCALTYKESKKKKICNCCCYVSYTLQRMKLLPCTGYFYGSDGKIRYRGTLTAVDLGKIANVKFFDKRPSECHLKPGDIVTYKNPAHTQVYAGKDKNGNLLWYSWGRNDIKKGIPRKRGNYNNKRIQHRIRLK